MSLSTTQLIISISIAVILASLLAYFMWKQRKEASQGIKKIQKENTGTRQLQLQAYERLILLADRISLPQVISRTNTSGVSARDMQMMLTQAIKQEYEYNITQQIYVSAEAWEAIRNLKEQNLLIINQVASFLPPEASGQDLNKSLLELLVNNPKASLHNIVSDALSYEAKKLM
jgi:hypothetical protein